MEYEIHSDLTPEQFNRKYKINAAFAEKLKLTDTKKTNNSIAGKPKILAVEILKRFFSNPIVVISTIVFLSLIILAFVVKYTSPYLPGKPVVDTWKSQGYKITGSEVAYYAELPPTFSPFKEYGGNVKQIEDIQKYTNPDPNVNPYYEYFKTYLIPDKTYFVIDNSSSFPIYKIDVYKLWQVTTLDGYMSQLKNQWLAAHPGSTPTQSEFNIWFAEAKEALNQVNLQTWFGTTGNGADIWTTVWAGTLESLWIALVVATIETVIGVFVGAILGFYAGKWIDTIFSRVIEIFQAPPSIIWLLMFVSIWGTSAPVLIAGLLFVGWTYPIAATRLFVITVKDEEYITASKSIGASPARQIFSHALPAVIGKIAQNYVRRIPAIIISIASLAFLGFFSDPTSFNLGKIMIDNTALATVNPWVMILPATILLLISISLQFVALGLHDALDPKVIKLKK
ncbi:ABC transporter permease [Mycoplasmopsis adleri]|uniref:ABC transporter permease n=1 Tax=Mycoplasmopsis adleri TaxID=51362 RepID=UPI003872CF77